MANSTVSYIDPSGQSQTGYLIGGKTYKDAAGTQRIENGSIVNTAGGQYRMTENGGVPYTPPATVNSNSNTANKPVTTQYIDPSGQSQTGYIVNGRTYTDPAGTQRIANGSIVGTNGGIYEMTDAGGIPYIPKAVNENAFAEENEMLKQQMQDLFEQQQQAQQLRIDQAVRDVQNQIPQLNQQYDKTARQAYINYRLGNRDAAEGLAALGLGSTGLSESTLAGNQNQYQSLINQSELERNNAINNLTRQINEIRASGNIALAEQAADWLNNYINWSTNRLDAQQAQNNWQRTFNYNAQQDALNNQWRKNEWDYNLGRDDIADKRYQTEWEYNVNQAAENNLFNRLLDSAKILASGGNYNAAAQLYNQAKQAYLNAGKNNGTGTAAASAILSPDSVASLAAITPTATGTSSSSSKSTKSKSSSSSSNKSSNINTAQPTYNNPNLGAAAVGGKAVQAIAGATGSNAQSTQQTKDTYSTDAQKILLQLAEPIARSSVAKGFTGVDRPMYAKTQIDAYYKQGIINAAGRDALYGMFNVKK